MGVKIVQKDIDIVIRLHLRKKRSIVLMSHVDMLKAMNCSFLKDVALSYNCNGVRNRKWKTREKEQFIAYIYNFKTFPTLHFDFEKINALLYMCVSIYGTVCWTAFLLWLQVVWNEKKERPVYIF